MTILDPMQSSITS